MNIVFGFCVFIIYNDIYIYDIDYSCYIYNLNIFMDVLMDSCTVLRHGNTQQLDETVIRDD